MSWHVLHELPATDATVAAGFLDGVGVRLRVVDAEGAEIAREQLASTSSRVSVQVHEGDLPLATDVVREALRERRKPAIDTSLDRLGLTIRACAVTACFAPLGLLLAPKYLLRASRSATRPREHGWTIAGIAACVPSCVFYALFLHDLLGR